MKNINSILLFTLTLSVLSCGSETKTGQSTAKSENGSTKETTNSNKEVVSGTNNKSEISSDSKEETNNGTEPIDLSSDDSTIVSTETTSNGDPSTTISSTDPIVEVADDYDFHSFKQLNSLLNKYVSSGGKVNYKGIKSDLSTLETVLKEFGDNYPASSWSKNQKLAYWINAYNIYTIKLIVDNYPTSSITKITAEPWKKKFIQLGGKTISLNIIENEIIRKDFSEPRVHFALNCASASCPVLLNAAYTAGNLNSKLTSQTKRFLNDTSKNTFEKKEIFISQIFDWYKEDFTKSGTVIDFINKYRTEQLVKQKISYSEYSWDLND